MKNIFYALLSLIFISSSATVIAQTEFTARLSGQQEVLPVLTEASGQITTNLTGNVLTVEGTFADLESDFSAAHIHLGFAGQNGDVLFELTVVPDANLRGGTLLPAANTFTLNSAQTSALENRNFYINIHTADNPNGELRGQLLPDRDATYISSLTGSQEVPAVLSNGQGGAILELSGNQLTVSGAFSGLDSDFDANTGAHIHIGLAGINGLVIKPLNITVGVDNRSGVIDPDQNSFILTAEEITALQTRALYINVHSTGQPGGEIRGQVTPEVTALFRAHLSGSNENPAVTTTGNGTIIAELNGRILNLSGAFTDLSDAPTAAHVHFGFAGENNDVWQSLDITPVADGVNAILAGTNSFNLNTGDVASLLRRGFYINIHTENHPAGEIRGQLLPLTQTVFNARLSGNMMCPTVQTTGGGALKAELQGDQLVVTGVLSNLEGNLAAAVQGGVIVHVGVAGTEGAVSFLLQAITTDDDLVVFEADMNTFTLSTTQRTNLIRRRNYIQVYTNAHQMGELRGQLLPEATTYLMAKLSGTSVIPAVDGTGTGVLLLEVNGENLAASGSFNDLSNNFNGIAQIHNGLAGSSGEMIFSLNSTGAGARNGVFDIESNTFALTPMLLTELLERQMYVDLNTAVNLNGELRGQLLPFADQYYSAYLAGGNEVPAVNTTAFGNLKLELAGTQLRVSGSFTGLTSDYDPMVGSHLHLARNGQNGDVVFGLTPILSFDERSASYLTADNTFDLSMEEIAALQAGRIYVNVHSVVNATGEVRGQTLFEPLQFPAIVDSFLLAELETVTIAGLPETTFAFDWLAAEMEDDTLTYRWQLATEPTFDNIVANAETDTATVATFTLLELDNLLAGLNLAVNDELDLYQRVLTSNGSLQTASVSRLIRLRRGVVNPPVVYAAQLLGSNEVLPILTRATGNISAVLTSDTLTVSGIFDNLQDTVLTELAGGAHLHIGYAGQNGPVAIPLNITLDNDSLGGQFLVENNTFTLTEEQRTAFVNRQMYVNIHSAAFPGGELRGQIVPPNVEVYSTNLFGNNEVPTVMSSGHGALLLDLQDTILTVSGSFENLDGNFTGTPGAHLHLGVAGQNGDVIIGLDVTIGDDGKSGVIEPTNNTYTIDGNQIASIVTRGVYANVHSDLHPSGELRGQVTEPAIAIFRAHLSGTNEVPAVTTLASGQLIAELTSNNTLVVSGSYNNLEGDLATELAGGGHIHVGMAGENGMVLFPFNIGATDTRNGFISSLSNEFDLTETAITTLLERGLYVNFHSEQHLGGELRGQLLPESQIVFNGILSGIFEVPQATNTAAYGQVKAELSGDQLTVSGAYQNLSADLAVALAGGAHIHLGAAGQNGSIEHLLSTATNDMSGRAGTFMPFANTFTLTEQQITELKTRQNYVNIHSVAEAGGELRAQLLPEATTYFVAPLGGNSVVTPQRTDATGMTIFEVNGLNGTLTGSLMGLEDDFGLTTTSTAGGASLHYAFAGSTGDVALPLNASVTDDFRAASFLASDNQFELTFEQLDTIRQRMSYVNIFSAGNRFGEIRGQLLPLATTYFTTNLSGGHEVPSVSTSGSGGLKFELVDSTLSVSGSFNNLSSRFAAEIAGGSHLHLAPVGQNGEVVFVLNPTLSTDSLSAIYSADNNTFVLNAEEIEALRSDNYYVNIHSANFANGELRGQVLLETNFSPSATAIITNPVDNAVIDVTGRPTDQLTINWTPATDSSQLVYRWRLSPEIFTSFFLDQAVGTNLEARVTLGALDTLLAEQGLAIGDSITLVHNILASDGSLFSGSANSTITFVRGEVAPPSGYTALLAGHNEVLPVLTMASGRVTAQLDGDSLKLVGRFDNLNDTVLTELANGAHLHLGYAGQNGAVVQPLNIDLDDDNRGGTFREADNTFAFPDSLVTALNNGQIYVNIHSAAFPGGELRAQLLPDVDLAYQTNVFGSYQPLTTMTQAHGAVQLQVIDSQLVVSGAFANLEGDFGGMVHLHTGMAGQTGAPTIALNATTDVGNRSGIFEPENNTFDLTTDQLNAIAQRNIYFNLHTAAHPAGELRGQVGEPNMATFRAHLSGNNEVPAVTTIANGMVIAELVNDTTLVVHGSFEDLESDFATDIGAHLHLGSAGNNGGVEFPLTVAMNGETRSGTIASGANRFTINAAQKEALYSRNFYVNVHSEDHPGGEIRGQLLPESQIVFNAHLAGIFEVNPANTAAFGAVKAELLGNQLHVSGGFNNLSSAVDTDIAGGAHIHLGAAGQNGGVEFLLNSNLSSAGAAGMFMAEANTFTLDSTQIANLRQRLNYINIHTTNFAGGELRGQLLPEATTYFLAALGGNSEVPAVNTAATGMTLIEVNGENAVLTGSFNGLESAFNRAIAGGAHIHQALAGSNGDVVVLINTDSLNADGMAVDTAGVFRASDNQFAISSGLLDTMRQRMHYVNIHSADNPPGEIRGQLLPFGNGYFTTNLLGINEVDPVQSSARGGLKLDLVGDELTVTGSFSGLESNFATEIGAHLHLEAASTNGNVIFALTPSLDSATAGDFLAIENQFVLDSAQLVALRTGNIYANIHSVDNASGEIRGQILTEINFFPTRPEIVSPMDGATVEIDSTNTDDFVVNWSAATDDNDLVYIWQLATDNTFGMPLINTNVGAMTRFSATQAEVDTLLGSAGIAVGDSIQLFHRAIASDGSLQGTGEFASVILKRVVMEDDTMEVVDPPVIVADSIYVAHLSGSNEVLPVLTMASGIITATLQDTLLTVSGRFDNLTDSVATDIANGAHIHLGYAGQNGAVIFPLNLELDDDQLGGTLIDTLNQFTLTTEQITALAKHQLYVNIHTNAFRSGELRGQLVSANRESYQTNLFGNNEVPSIMTQAHGAVQLQVSDTTLVVTGAFDNLEGQFNTAIAGGAHLHLGMAGENGAVDVILNATVDADATGGVFAPENNTFPITEAQREFLAQRNVYINIHSTRFPGGEIRGQLGESNLATFRAHLSGNNEVPAVTTTANGMVIAELVNDTTLVIHGSFENLESDFATDIGAHLHLGSAGNNGGVAFPLTVENNGETRSGTIASGANRFIINAAQKEALFSRNFYVNVHSVDHSGGEIRGQLLPESQIVFNAHLAGIFEVNPANTAAFGAVKAELLGNQLRVSGGFNNLSSAVDTDIAGGAHIHLGAAGQNGGVEFILNSNLSPAGTVGMFTAEANTFTLDSTQIANLRQRLNYINIHTTNFAGGELRGQLLPEATTYLLAALGGNSEVPAVNTAATGMTLIEVNGENAVLTGSFSGLESAFNRALAGGAHIHQALAGDNGGVQILINTDSLNADGMVVDTAGVFRASDNQFAISSGLLDTMRQRMHYVNIHSIENASGEIRGQILPFGNGYFTTNLLGINEVEPVQSTARGGLKLDLVGNQLTVTGSFSGVPNDLIAGTPAHLHLGDASENGDVIVALTPAASILPDLDSIGVFLAADNQFELDSAQLAALRTGNIYANIHSTDNPSGEIRGQILPEINFFPTQPAITNPMDGATVEIDSSNTDNFVVNWSAAQDDNDLVYIWQLAANDTFNMPLINTNVGAMTSFSATRAEVDTLLGSAGIAVGDSIQLFHRAIASDGSLQGIGTAASVILKRVMMVEDTMDVVDPPVVIADSIAYIAQLSGSNEVLPILTMASGEVTAILRDTVLTVSGRFDNLMDSVATDIVGGAHIHLGYAGENGDVIFPLNIALDDDQLGGTFVDSLNEFTLSATQIAALANRQLYINIHSNEFRGGELRGQLVPADHILYQSNLFGNYEVPTVMSNGQGAVILDVENDTLTVSGTFRNLDGDFDANIAGGAHLHLGLTGQTGGVEIPLVASLAADLRSGSFEAVDNVFVLTEEQKTALAQDNFYVNLHTTQVASGEIRGQVHDLGLATFRAHLSGSNEVPVVTTQANGMVVATLVNDTTLVVSGSFMDLESDLATEIAGGAHLHLGSVGATGGVIFPLNITSIDDQRNGTFAKSNNTFTITANQKAALYNREIYVNIHTANNAAGELRGQLLPESQVIFNAHLSGIFEVNPVPSKATGAVKVELLGNQMTVSGSFDNLSSAVATEIVGGAHIHLGVAGRNGGVEFPLDMRLNSDFTAGRFLANTNTFTLTDTQVENLRARRNYVNIHTANFQGGELRGQLLPEATTYFLAALGGNSEVPAVATEAVGHALVEVNGSNAILTGSYMGLESGFNADLAGGAHLHTAFAGSNGGIAQLVASTPDSDTSGIFNAFNNQFALSDGLLDTIRQRGVYLNIHSLEDAGGEIRGQLLPLGTTFFTTNLLGTNEVQPIETEAQGGLKLELTNNVLTVTGSFNNLGSDFDANVAGGAHLHIATPAENGEVTILLNTTIADDDRSGFYAAADNTFALDSAQVAALCSGNFYANIHTEEFAGGELRGQILPEINFHPQGDVAITQPEDGANIVTTNNPTGRFQVTWNAATDRDTLVYIWQLATDNTFTNLLINENVGFNPVFNLTLGAVDTLLMENGVMEGDSITLFHRAVASDGSLQQFGESASVTLIREDVIDADFVAILTGQNEVLPVATPAYGEVYAELEGNQLILEGFFENLTAPVATEIAGGGHIHLGYAGENGDVVFPINLEMAANGTSGTIERAANTFTLNSNQLNQLAGRQLYVNIHSERFTGGEIRGQFLPINSEAFVANLFGNNEVPTILSEGHGALVLDLAGNQLTVSGAFADLEGAVDTEIAGGAHLHLGVTGRNGEVTILLNITPQGNGRRGKFFPADNVFDLNNEQLAALRNHELYANIHTTRFAAGELRGQVAPLARTNFRAHLSGSNEVPVVTSFATGQLNALMINDSTLVVSGSINNLESDINIELAGGAHLHIGYAGETGEIVFPLELQIADGQRNAVVSAEDNVFVIDAGTRELLYQRALYFNVHSLDHAAGELRGQLLPESQAVFNGFLSGIFETPAVSTTALGGMKVELSGSRMTVTGSFNNLSSAVDENIAGGAHLHIAPAGRNGDVFVVLEPNLTSDGRGGNFLASNNTFELTEEEMFRLTAREVYANIHSTEEQMGELRAQILPEAAAYFVAPLSGASVIPATNTDAMGMMVAEVNGEQLMMSGSYMGLSSTIDANVAGGTHLHRGQAGQIGNRVQILSPAADASGTGGVFNVFGNTFVTDAIILSDLRNRNQYVDLHTVDNRGGELRGQLLPLATAYYHTSLDGWNEVQPVATTGVGGLKMELTGNNLTVSGAFSDLAGDFDTNVGAHLHFAGVGENGGVIFPLVVEPADDLRSGSVASTDNVFELPDSLLMALQAGDLYANFHTTEFPSGELRGQVLAEINDFPSRSATINTPMNGSNVTLEGNPATPFRATWSTASDRDDLAYIWQLSTNPEFTDLVVNQNGGAAQLFETDFATVDMLLANSGIETGATVTLYHRAVATDGSNYTAGPTSTVNVTRGMIVNTDNPLAEQFDVQVFPTLTTANSNVNVQITATERGAGRLTLFNQLGQLIDYQEVELLNGANDYQLQLTNVVAGMYYVQLEVDGVLLPIEKVVVQ